MSQTITLQKLFSFPLADFDSYTDLEVEEMKPSGQVVRCFHYTAPDNTYFDIAKYFTEVQVNFFQSGAYNIIFSGVASNTTKINNIVVVFWNALYAILGADNQGKTQMSYEDYYPRLRSGGELHFDKTWRNHYASFWIADGYCFFSIRSQIIEEVADKEVAMEELLFFPDEPQHIPDTSNNAPQQNTNSGCLGVLAFILVLAGLFAL